MSASQDLIFNPDEREVLDLCQEPPYVGKCSSEFWKEYLEFNYPGIVLPKKDIQSELVEDITKAKKIYPTKELLHKDSKLLEDVEMKLLGLYESYRFSLLLKLYRAAQQPEKTRIEQEEGFTAKVFSLYLYYNYQKQDPVVMAILDITQDDYLDYLEGSQVAIEFSLPDYHQYEFDHSMVEVISTSSEKYLQEIADNDGIALIPVRGKTLKSYEGNPFSVIHQNY